MAKQIILKGHKISKGKAVGEAVVTHEAIEFRGRINPETGQITDAGSELDGVILNGKILVYPMGKGSTQGAWTLYELACRKIAPAGIINTKAVPIDATGAIAAKVPMVDRLDGDPVKLIKTGDWVEMDATKGIVKITKKG